MRITITERQNGKVFACDSTYDVPDSEGREICANGWGIDVSGQTGTGRRVTQSVGLHVHKGIIGLQNKGL